MELLNQPFNSVENRSLEMQIFRDYVQLIVTDDLKYIIDEDLAVEEPDDEDRADYNLIPENLQQYMHYSLQHDHINKEAYQFSKHKQCIVDYEHVNYHGKIEKVMSMRGVVYSKILGDILFFLKLDSSFQLKKKVHELEVVGFIYPPHYQAYVSKNMDHIKINKEVKDIANHILITDFRLKNATYDSEKQTLIDFGNDTQQGYACEPSIFFTVAIKSDEEFPTSNDEDDQHIVAVNLKCEGCIDTVRVFFPNKTPITDEEWRAKDPILEVGYF